MILPRLLAIAALAAVIAPPSATAQLRTLSMGSALSTAPEKDPANASSRDRIAPPSSGSCLHSRVPCVTPVDAAARQPSRNPLAAVPIDAHKRTRIVRGALIGGLAGFVLIGLYGTIKNGLCDAARCPSAGRYALFGTLGGAAFGALAGAADP